jgi:hypothetical protein
MIVKIVHYCFTIQPGSHSRELNPFWKDGGTGLPSEEPGTSSNSSSTKAEETKRPVGPGGSTWLRRAFRRAQEMAEEQGRPVEDVVSERFGVSVYRCWVFTLSFAFYRTLEFFSWLLSFPFFYPFLFFFVFLLSLFV